jgi:hypothetical protein
MMTYDVKWQKELDKLHANLRHTEAGLQPKNLERRDLFPSMPGVPQ